MDGDSSETDPKYFMDRDMILVTFNFRSGIFGFLSTGDEHIPGNMGLKDQSLVLKWVSENIASFGGDPKRVTLAGCSSGAASVQYHYLSPMSAGLFSNGISFSGGVTSRRYFDNHPLRRAVQLAEAIDCPTNNTLDMIKCFENHQPAYDFYSAYFKIWVNPYCYY